MPQNEVKRRKGSKHDKTGCLTCRYRRKKCVENTFPACGTCIRLNLECIREPVRRIHPPSKNPVIEKTVDLAQPDRPPQSTALSALPLNGQLSCLPLNLESLRRRHSMNHYIKVLSELLTVSKHDNSFLSDFLPMAMESPALAEALIAYASGHLSSLDPSYTSVSLEARSKALSALSKAVCLPAQTAVFTETTLSACLILLTSEVCLGSHSSWYNHLIGAKHLITSAPSYTGLGSSPLLQGPEALKMTSEGRWVLRNFAFHDIIGSVTLRTKPLLDPAYLEGITDEVDTYLGVASGILVFISQITCLSWSTDSDKGNLLLQYLEIESALKSWQCPDGTHSTLEAVAYAYRGAALVHLCRQMRRYLENPLAQVELSPATLQDSVQTEVLNTLASIDRVPVDDISESSLLFPLFIAGGEAKDSSQMDVIRERLQRSFQKRRFRNISRALEVLEELWACQHIQSETGGRDTDWEDILNHCEEPLLLT